MSILKRYPWLTLVAALLLVAALESVAAACPTCKDSLAANDPARQGMVRGYFYSILFMLAMPFTIFGALSGYFYYEVRKARRLKAQAQTQSPPPSLASAPKQAAT